MWWAPASPRCMPDAAEELALHLRHMPPGVSVSLADPTGHVVYSTAEGAGGERARARPMG